MSTQNRIMADIVKGVEAYLSLVDPKKLDEIELNFYLALESALRSYEAEKICGAIGTLRTSGTNYV